MEIKHAPVITIDGPSGSGKGTLSYMLSKLLSWHLLDSGALYRILALICRETNADLEDQEQIVGLASQLDVSFKLGESKEVLSIQDGIDVTNAIRNEGVGEIASIVARMPKVRDTLLTFQKDFLRSPGLVADGRDMGTVVFPNAIFKIFLIADEAVRATRRQRQLMEKGESVSLARLRGDIEARDRRDVTRIVSPLVPAAGAFVVDSSDISATEVLDKVVRELQNLALI